MTFHVFAKEDDLWPVTIMKTRYGGTYEGGTWVAVNQFDGERRLEGWDGGDVECATWWEENANEQWVAVGATPNDAYQHLLDKQVVDDVQKVAFVT